MNHNTILSINVPNPHSVKDKNNIITIINKNSRTPTAADRPQQSMMQQRPQNNPVPSIPSHNSSIPPRRQIEQPQICQPALTAGQQNTQGTASSPIEKPIPALQNKVQKGQKILLSSGAVTTVDACFGWNVTDTRCDVDVSAFLLGADGKVIGDSWFVFYGQPTSPDQSTKFMQGSGADREIVQIDFGKLNPQVKKIVFVLTINDALKNRLHFGMLKDAYVRIMDKSGKELVSFLMTEYYNNVISMMIGELYQHNGIWKFNAVGNGVAKDLAGLCALYGVQVV
ncbi:MAG: TerD family protein [Lachnospiraceae bacterium]|nr:TerD family protein [Lachnospiraceae bacterium]